MAQRKKLFSHFTKGMGFSLATLGAGFVTILFAGTTLVLVVSVTGIPLAILTGIATAGSAEITHLLYNRTSHHIYHSVHDRHHYHHRSALSIDKPEQSIRPSTVALSTLHNKGYAGYPIILPCTDEITVVCQTINNQETTDSVDNLSIRIC